MASFTESFSTCCWPRREAHVVSPQQERQPATRGNAKPAFIFVYTASSGVCLFKTLYMISENCRATLVA